MAAPLPTIDLSGLDPAQVKALNRELVSLSKVEIPRVRLSLKALGGAYGRQASQLRGAAESIILMAKISNDGSIRNLANQMENSLMATLSFMERSAFKTKQAVMVELKTTTQTEERTRTLLEDAQKSRISIEEQTKREILRIEDEISIAKKNISNKSEDEVKREVEILRERIREQERLRESTIKSIDAEEKRIEANRTISEGFSSNYRNLLQEFAQARTDDEREVIQQRLAGQMAGEKQSLQILKERFQSERQVYADTTSKLSTVSGTERDRMEEELKVRRETIKVLGTEINSLEQDIVVREKGIQRTTEQYKRGLKGFAGEVVSKSFTGGLFGALRGEGFGDLFTNIAKIGLERTGILGKTMPKFLGGGNVGAFLYGTQSEEARKATALTSQQITTQGAAIAKVDELITKQIMLLEQITSRSASVPGTPAVPGAVPVPGVPPVPTGTPAVPGTPSTPAVVGSQTVQSMILSADEIKTFAESIKSASESIVLNLDTMVKSVSSVSSVENTHEEIIKRATDALQKLESKTIEVEYSQKILKSVTDSVTSALQSLQTKSSDVSSSEQVLKTVTDSVSSALNDLQTKSSDVSSSEETTKTTIEKLQNNLNVIQKNLSESSTSEQSIKTLTEALQNLRIQTVEVSNLQQILKTTTSETSSALETLKTNISSSSETESKEKFVQSVKTISDSIQNLSIKTTELLKSQESLKNETLDVANVEESKSLALDQSSVIVNLNIDSQQKLSENTSKTTEEMTRISSSLDSLYKTLDTLIKTQQISLESTQSLASSQISLKTTTESVDKSKKSLERTVSSTNDSMTNLNTNVDSLVSSIDLGISKSERETSEKTSKEDISDALVQLKREESTESEDEQLSISREMDTDLKEILQVGKSSSDDLKTSEEISTGTLLPSEPSRMPKMEEFTPVPPIQEQAYTSMVELSTKALERGSIYTHDIHSELILSSILGVMQRDSETLSDAKNSIAKTEESSSNVEMNSEKSISMEKTSEGSKSNSVMSVVKNAIMDTVSSTKKNIVKVKEAVVDSTRNVVQKSVDIAKSTMSSVVKGTVGMAGKMYSRAAGVASAVGGTIGKGYSIAKESMNRGYSVAKEAIGGSISGAGKLVSGGYTKIKSSISDIFQSRSRESTKTGFLKSAKEKISNTASSLRSRVSDIFQSRSRESGNNSFLKVAKEKMSNSFKSVTQFFTKPRGTFGGMISGAKQGMTKAFGKMTGFFKGTSEGSKKKGGIVSSIKDFIFGKKEADGKSEDTALYTHDVFSERLLQQIYDLFAERFQDKESKGKGTGRGKSGFGKGEPDGNVGLGKFKGIAQFLKSIAVGIKSFASTKVFVGALGLAAVGASVIPFAYGMTLLADVPFGNIVAASAGLIGLALVAKNIGKMAGDVLKGAGLIAVIGLSVIPGLLAFRLLKGLDPSIIWTAVGAMVGISALATGLGYLSSMGTNILAGVGLLAAIGAAFIPFTFSLSLLKGIDAGIIWNAVGAMAAISVLALGLGALAMTGIGAVGIAAGAALLAMIGAAFIPFAFGVSLLGNIDTGKISELGPALMSLIPAILSFSMMTIPVLFASAALLALGMSLIPLGMSLETISAEKTDALTKLLDKLSLAQFGKAKDGLLGVALGITAVGISIGLATAVIAATKMASAIGSWLGLGEVSVLDQIFGLAEISDKLMQTAMALMMIADAIKTIGDAFITLDASGGNGLETIEKIVAMDATQIKTLQDVSLAMEKVSSANQQLKGENEAMKVGAAIGNMGGAGGGNATVITNMSSGGSMNMFMGGKSGRNSDPSILFSGERYYSMIYR